MEIFVVLGVVVLWIALQTWILPRFGVSTCMSNACRPSSAAPQTVETRQMHVPQGSVSPSDSQRD